MGVPTSEVGYTPAMPRREDHEVHKGHVVAVDQKKLFCFHAMRGITWLAEELLASQEGLCSTEFLKYTHPPFYALVAFVKGGPK